MPIRAFRASTSYAGAHVKANLRVWTGLLALLSAALLLMLYSDTFGLAGLWGDMLVLSGMVLGVLIIMISHEGYEQTKATDDHLATG